jgi:isopentenyl-diphosphate delta-isomerase
MTVSKRKQEHIEISLNQNVQFKNKTTGFEAYDFIHCALPELNYEDISTKTTFLGKTLSFPLIICAITGGHSGAMGTNQALAEICQEEKIALGVGSQRQLIENDEHIETFRIVREKAPDIVIIGNIGASQILETTNFSILKQMVSLIQADGMAVHLNPLQELLQPEGNSRFRGVLKSIERLVKEIEVPVIIKEVGCGISREVAKKLKNVGIRYIDIAGAGGTSWAGIESFRCKNRKLANCFWDWGIPTAQSLKMISDIKDIRIIASGGIQDGITLAKALAMGAELCGAALPILKTLIEKNTEGLTSLIRLWREELQLAMFLTGSRTLIDLQRKGILETKQ